MSLLTAKPALQSFLNEVGMSNDRFEQLLCENDPLPVMNNDGTIYLSLPIVEKLIIALKEPHTTMSSTDDVGNTLDKSYARDFDEYQPNEAAAISNKAIDENDEISESETSSSSISMSSSRKEVCDDITNSIDYNDNFENDEYVAWSEQSDSFQNESESNLYNPCLLTLLDESISSTLSYLNPDDNLDIIFDRPFREVRKEVLSQMEELEKHYKTVRSKCEFDVAYIDTNGTFKVLRSTSLSEAKLRAFNLKDIWRVPFAFVLIAQGDESAQCKSKKQSKKSLSKENSPSITGFLHSVLDDEHSKFPLTFYLDTGADSGSIGYNYDIVQHFILTVDNVNGLLQPAILCQVSNETIEGEEVQIFDIDEDPDWNAIGLATLKNYKLYIDNKEPRVIMGKYNEVTIKDTEKTVEVTFPK